MGGEKSGKERKLDEVIAYRREIEAQVRRMLNSFKRAHAANSWLAEKLSSGDEIEKMAAARLLGFRQAREASEALAEALRQHRKDATVALELARALERVNSPQSAEGLFYRLFDDTDALVQASCSVALSRMGSNAKERLYAIAYSAEFQRFLGENGKAIHHALLELRAIEELARQRRSAEELRAMEREMRRHPKPKGNGAEGKEGNPRHRTRKPGAKI